MFVYDNILPINVAKRIDDEINNLRWSYNYFSTKVTKQPHWNILFGNNKSHIYNPIFNAVCDRVKDHVKLKLKRVYVSAHTYGIEPPIHKDDGYYTIIYYPKLNWESHWLGGTALWNDDRVDIDKYCNYVGNRAFIFKAETYHQAMPVSKLCYELRSVIILKTVERI